MGKKSRKKVDKKQMSGGNRNTIFVGALLLLLLGFWGFNQLNSSNYPGSVAGTFFDTPVVSADTGKVTVPEEVLDNNKLVFVDVKLETSISEFTYLGRKIILGSYRSGQYLPLLYISTPEGNIIGGVRVCEPCSSFSFHIVDRKYLQCDACGTRWNIETLQGISGGCINYPPPRLPTGIINGVVIEAGQTRLSLLA